MSDISKSDLCLKVASGSQPAASSATLCSCNPARSVRLSLCDTSAGVPANGQLPCDTADNIWPQHRWCVNASAQNTAKKVTQGDLNLQASCRYGKTNRHLHKVSFAAGRWCIESVDGQKKKCSKGLMMCQARILLVLAKKSVKNVKYLRWKAFRGILSNANMKRGLSL